MGAKLSAIQGFDSSVMASRLSTLYKSSIWIFLTALRSLTKEYNTLVMP